MLRKILFVDDDLILRTAIDRVLATHRDHFSTVMASDGFEAVQKLKQMPFSLVILDLVMPRMDGISLVNHIREKYPDIPIVIISGMPVEQMHQLAATSGIVAYLSKPFQADELIATVMNTLRKEAEGGIMHEISPAVFLQLMEMDAKSCTIRILDRDSKQGGILYFIDGQLVDARIGEENGMDAALRVFTWNAATIFLRNDCQPREDTINSGLQPIIMKAAGMKDESEGTTDDEEDEDYDDEDDDEEEFEDEASDGEERHGNLKPSPGPAITLGDLDDLDDLELPGNFPAPLISDLADLELSLEDELSDPEPSFDSPHDRTLDLLEKTAGVIISHNDIHHDPTLDKVLRHLEELGVASRFGAFRAGYLATGKNTDRILLPDKPATVVHVQPDCPRDKITEVLRSGAAGSRKG